MKIVEPKYEILTDISEGGIKELQQIERVARVCYKSEDKITPDGESAKKLVGFLVKQGHEAMLEHSQLSVLFTCDRGVANELVRHRIASFAQESTRYCNYSKEKFGGELSFIRPYYIDVTDTDKKRESAEYTPGSTWLDSCESAEILYKDMYKLCYNPIGGTFSANFNDENFVENLINFAETFDPSAYASVEIDGPCSIKELAETVKNMEKIQLLLLKVALAFVKIDKESMVNENAAKNV